MPKSESPDWTTYLMISSRGRLGISVCPSTRRCNDGGQERPARERWKVGKLKGGGLRRGRRRWTWKETLRPLREGDEAGPSEQNAHNDKGGHGDMSEVALHARLPASALQVGPKASVAVPVARWSGRGSRASSLGVIGGRPGPVGHANSRPTVSRELTVMSHQGRTNQGLTKPAVEACLKVEMWAGRVAGRPGCTYRLTLADTLTATRRGPSSGDHRRSASRYRDRA